jgi:hypothetical protein
MTPIPKEKAQEILSSCVELINSKNKNSEQIFFEDKLVVKNTPHNEIYRCYGCATDAHNKLWLFNGENWHEILPAQVNAGFVLQSVFQRLTTELKSKLSPYERWQLEKKGNYIPESEPPLENEQSSISPIEVSSIIATGETINDQQIIIVDELK